VITIGSAGKLLGRPAHRLIRASSRTIASLVQARDSLDLGSPLLEQLACCWLLENENRLLPHGAPCWRLAGTCGALMTEYFPTGASLRRKEDFFWAELPECWRRCFPFALKAVEFTSDGTRFGLAGAFERYLVCPLLLSDEELRSAFNTLQPLWYSLTEPKESFA
jgi:DNA-binding transcriptional MocR family regulator